MKTEMKVLLYIKRGGQDKDGFSPLMGRISIKGKVRSEEHTSELQSHTESRMPSSA